MRFKHTGTTTVTFDVADCLRAFSKEPHGPYATTDEEMVVAIRQALKDAGVSRDQANAAKVVVRPMEGFGGLTATGLFTAEATYAGYPPRPREENDHDD